MKSEFMKGPAQSVISSMKALLWFTPIQRRSLEGAKEIKVLQEKKRKEYW